MGTSKNLLIVVDMQNDFIDGTLGTKEAVSIVPNVINKIKAWNGHIIFTKDTHDQNYLNTREGKMLPIHHCIAGTNGYKINGDVFSALKNSDSSFSMISKHTFGSAALPEIVRGIINCSYIEIIGLCTDICVISNVLLLKANYPEVDIAVDASCCAGSTPERHLAALEVMKSCQVRIINE